MGPTVPHSLGIPLVGSKVWKGTRVWRHGHGGGAEAGAGRVQEGSWPVRCGLLYSYAVLLQASWLSGCTRCTKAPNAPGQLAGWLAGRNLGAGTAEGIRESQRLLSRQAAKMALPLAASKAMLALTGAPFRMGAAAIGMQGFAAFSASSSSRECIFFWACTGGSGKVNLGPFCLPLSFLFAFRPGLRHLCWRTDRAAPRTCCRL